MTIRSPVTFTNPKLTNKVNFTDPTVTYSDLKVTYSGLKVTYSDPKVTHSDPTHLSLPLPTYTLHI